MQLLLVLSYNWTVDGLVVHLPPLSVDVYHNNTQQIGVAAVQPFVLRYGMVRVVALVTLPLTFANNTAKLVQNILDSMPGIELALNGANDSRAGGCVAADITMQQLWLRVDVDSLISSETGA